MALASEFSSVKQTPSLGLMTFFSNVVSRLKKAYICNKTYNALNALDAAQLYDLGLTRSMIRRVAYQAAYEN